ncbi:hypothetical protein [Chitiniphilus eburneus]|uniref:Uncharacterized protein n=1 Tax=Chitiniphilus eburneus TaxID=2571148 RepID=A0A4U0PRN0_9NEIS|nr:hypothetical protein [Chitiniphilus eburneus]TJZ71026.1 hypothetical protein FAZ21_13750 [Chitiniphilus eburneus]
MAIGPVQSSSNWQALQQTQRSTAPSASDAVRQTATDPQVVANADQTRTQLTDSQKEMANVLYLSNTAQTSMDIYMAVTAEQNNQDVTWSVQPDVNNNLNFVTQGPDGGQSIPYSAGSLLNTKA